MFYNRVDIFNLTFFQLIRKFIKIIFWLIVKSSWTLE